MSLNLKNIKGIEEFDAFIDGEIDRNRKGLFELRINDHLGNKMKNVSITVEHVNHDFVFGICPNGHISMTNELACGSGEDTERYWKLIADLFNGTTLWWGWEVLEPAEGQWTFDRKVNGYGPMDVMVKRAEELGHYITGHALLYPRPDVTPEWVQNCSPAKAVEYLERHIRKVVGKYKDRVNCWHPVNEAYKPLQTVGNLNVNEGPVYKWVHEVAPHSGLVDNGGYVIHPEFYEKGIKNAGAFGADVDYLGIRGYFELYKPDAVDFFKSLWLHFDNLVKLYGKKLKFTEIGASSRKPDREYMEDPTIDKDLGIAKVEGSSDIELNEETQAEFLVRMYKLMFAHKDMYECSYWDLLDSFTWNKVEGGLVRHDFSPKLAYNRLQELIHKQWSTKAALTTDDEGKCSFRGYYGTYKINAGGREFIADFTKESTNNFLCIY